MNDFVLLTVAAYSFTGIAIARTQTTFRPGISLLSLFNAAWFVLFVFCPLNIIALGSWAVRQKYAFEQWGHGDISTAIYLLFFYTAFVIGYKPARATVFTVNSPVNVDRKTYLIIAAFSALGISAISFHTALLGGIDKAIFLAPLSRGNLIEIDNPYLFIRQFGYFIPAAFLLSFASYLQKKQAIYPTILLGALTFYYGLITFGRREFFYPILVAFTLCMTLKKPRHISALVLVLISTLWILAYHYISSQGISHSHPQTISTLKNISQYEELTPLVKINLLGAAQLEYQKAIQGLCDSFIHFVAAQKAAIWQFGFLKDIQELPLNFIPSRLFGLDRGKGMYGETSYFILGKPLQNDVGGEEPLGLPGYLLTNFTFFGATVIFYLLGIAARRIDSIMKPSTSSYTYSINWLAYILVLILFFEYLRDGVLVLILIPRCSWLLIVLYVYLLGRTANRHFCSKTL